MVTIVGSLLAAMGFFLSSFAPSLEVIYFTCGVLAGFGLSMPYVAGKIHEDRQMKVHNSCEQSGAFNPAKKGRPNNVEESKYTYSADIQ